MVLSRSCCCSIDSVNMFPTGCFYPPSMQTSKWPTSNDDSDAHQVSPLENKYDPAAVRFAQTDPSKYPFDNSPKCSLEFKYPQDMRWHPHTEFPCQLSFSPAVSDPYPTDPFPSTSIALPHTFKMENSYSYPGTVIPPVYTPQTADCFTGTQQFPQFKIPTTMNPMNSVKMTPTSTVNCSSNLPYRTGPGTNNVRVRTSEKYRMVYTDHQRLELEKEFLMSHFINAERKAQLSSSLQLTERQIKIWFQNRWILHEEM
uniref:Homeobox domain-containing protein n=1 Tax=Syphacia muris TaxID=451379 RepID=A0A0N5AW94_9BILA